MAIISPNASTSASSLELYSLLHAKTLAVQTGVNYISKRNQIMVAAYQAAAILVKALHKDQAPFNLLAKQVTQVLADLFKTPINDAPELYVTLETVYQRAIDQDAATLAHGDIAFPRI